MDRRLMRDDPSPILLGLSGGGDSLALLLIAHQWARRAGRQLVAVTIDHQLRAEGAAWAAWCARRCSALGVPHRTGVWTGSKPLKGLHAAARKARHALLAHAAREAGARVILLAHTADDRLEAAWMRAHGARTPSPREWSPSPVWPEGRGIFLLRPLLNVPRAALRLYLRERGEAWIEDPGNDDTAHLRIRARRAIDAGDAVHAESISTPSPGAPPLREGAGGELYGAADVVLNAGDGSARAWLAAALVCAGGGDRTPSRQALDPLTERLRSPIPFASTLAGAYLVFDGLGLMIAREARDHRRSLRADLDLRPGDGAVWDGRFEFTAQEPGWRAGFVAGRAGKLEKPDARALRRVPSAARPGAPMLIAPDGRLLCPTLRPVEGVGIRSLILGRLAASVGAIQHESAITHGETPSPALNPLLSRKRLVDEPS